MLKICLKNLHKKDVLTCAPNKVPGIKIYERDWLLKQASDVAPFKSFTWNQPDKKAFPRVKFVSDYVWRCLCAVQRQLYESYSAV